MTMTDKIFSLVTELDLQRTCSMSMCKRDWRRLCLYFRWSYEKGISRCHCLDEVKKRLYFCEDCPIERIRNGMMPEPCKGHLIRKFVKEFWTKCECSRICGNRIVQHGITRNLQVFWTAEGKGWGLRALDELPKGAFICEYVGEILTNAELFVTGKMGHSYPVLLEADWGSVQVLKDE
ncbi:histone-lysine N-methyltransferase SUVR4-like, partial [Phalaenopsis equestris]|uniref:histone-lysine N-methyltransferase SUVR4-like n=1 Tax=Phalaenopsis equestris TaxID=78828 RepID=UPI0009E38A75